MPNNKPKQSRPVDTTKVSQMDVCQTPPHALEPLYPYLNPDWIIWESAVGPEQILATTLLNKGYQVFGTDLMYGAEFNYFTYTPDFNYDIEITNMPFSIKYKWLEKAFSRGKRFALLAPYETTFAKEFQKLFKEYNNKPWYIEILSPERRINYKMPNKGWDSSAQLPTAWITWGLNIYKHNNDFLRTYYVPTRIAKYDDKNKEIQRLDKRKDK